MSTSPMPGPMLDRDQIIERLCQIAAEQVGLDRAEVNADSRFVEDLNFDSLDTVEFAMSTEDEFEINIPDEVAESAKTIGQATDAVIAHLRDGGRPG